MLRSRPRPRKSVQRMRQQTLHGGGLEMKEQNFVPREFEIFGGLDVDKKSMAVTFMSHQGILQSFSMPYRAEHLLSYVANTLKGRRSPLPTKPVPPDGAC